MRDFVNAPCYRDTFVSAALSLVSLAAFKPPIAKSLFSAACWAFNEAPCNSTGTSANMNGECRGQPGTTGCEGAERRSRSKAR